MVSSPIARLAGVLALAIALAWLTQTPSRAQFPIVGPGNAIICGNVANASPSTATTTSLVAGVGTARIYICGWHVTSTVATQNSFQLEYGTQGGPCTTPTTLTPAFGVINSAPSADHVDIASMQTAAGAQLCVVTTAATALQVMVYYNQF